MYLIEKTRNVFRRALQEFGPRSVKRRLWNVEFSGGRWDCLNQTQGDCLYPYIEKYVRGGSILDLGCGSGNTGAELAADSYRDYTGVDVSDVAIEKAKKSTEKCARTGKNRFFESDILTYVPAQQFDVILFRDSLYYVSRLRLKATLDRHSRYLKPDGVFIVRLWDAGEKYKWIVDCIVSHFAVLEEHFSEQPKSAVIVFQRKA
jgi:SAM-dependent methyltransferase